MLDTSALVIPRINPSVDDFTQALGWLTGKGEVFLALLKLVIESNPEKYSDDQEV